MTRMSPARQTPAAANICPIGVLNVFCRLLWGGAYGFTASPEDGRGGGAGNESVARAAVRDGPPPYRAYTIPQAGHSTAPRSRTQPHLGQVVCEASIQSPPARTEN